MPLLVRKRRKKPVLVAHGVLLSVTHVLFLSYYTQMVEDDSCTDTW